MADEAQKKGIDEKKVEEVINLIRPALQADGGDITLVGVDQDGTVNVELQGACAGCPLSQLTLSNSVERILKERVEGVERVVPAM